MAAVEGVITNPSIQAWWATTGIIFNLEPATTSSTGLISLIIFIGYSPPDIDANVNPVLTIPQLP